MEQNKYIPGDWVIDKMDLSPGYVQIKRISETFGKESLILKSGWVVYSNDVEPIPLTFEILKKIGWKKAFPNENIWKNGDIIIYDCLLKDNSWCFKVTGFEGGNIYFKFVHQLQHLLFGLGLDSNFDLTDTKEGGEK